MERRYFISSLLGVSVVGCAERDDSTERTPTTSTFGVEPVSEPDEGRIEVEMVSYDGLTSQEREFLDKLLPEGGIECESRNEGWNSLMDSLPSGNSVYLERESELFALYMSAADQVFISSADYGEFPIADC